jgi:hypothetical protein
MPARRPGDEDDMTAEQNKLLIHRLVEDAVNQSNLSRMPQLGLNGRRPGDPSRQVRNDRE